VVEHIVLFKLKPDATQEQRDELVSVLKRLKENVPGILELTAGVNFNTERGKGYSVALNVRFPDRAALEAYGPHPAHQEVVEKYVLPLCEDIVVADYEVA